MTTRQSKSKTKPKSTSVTPDTATFMRGQKWQLPTGQAQILHVGKTLVQYKFLKTGMVRGPLEMKSIPNFAEALKANKATLIASP